MSATAPKASATAPKSSATAIYRRLLGYAWPYRGAYLIGVLGMALYAGTDAVTVYFVRHFMNDTFLHRSSGVLIWLPLGIIGIFLLRGVGDFLANYFPGWVGRQVIKALRADLFGHYLRLPTAHYNQESSGLMLTRLTYHSELVAQAATDSLTVMIRDTLTIAGCVVWLFYLNWKLALFVLWAAPAIGWLVRSVNQRFRRYSTRIQNSMGDVTRVSKETLDAHRVVKVFNAQEHIGGLFERVNELNRHTNVRLISARASANPIVQLILSFGLAGVLYVASREVSNGTMQIGDFVAFLTALLLVPQPLRRVLNVAGPLQQGIAAGESVFEVLDTPPEPSGGTRPLSHARGDVEFHQVNFTYVADKGVVLRDINLKVAAGSTLAIVGRSGSGKSTLVSLLPRFYDPDSGSIRVDGADIREYGLAALRSQMSLVSQEIVLFNDTIRNNILFGAQGVSAAQFDAAVHNAYVTEFVEQLPQGFETVVGDQGALLSGGQRQRLAIARALLRDTPILILDEATSALDTAAERHIQAALDQLVKNRTTFVIAHRLSTVERADCIVVMQDGAIIESGSHAELLARAGAYAQLHQLQFAV